jgi:hypothetical protein
MWFAAALAGALASLAPSWRFVLGGAAVSWAAGALVARRRFIAQPATEARAAAVPAATAA